MDVVTRAPLDRPPREWWILLLDPLEPTLQSRVRAASGALTKKTPGDPTKEPWVVLPESVTGSLPDPKEGALLNSSLTATPVCLRRYPHSALDQPSAAQIRWVDLAVPWFPRTCTMIPTLDPSSVTFFSTGCPCTHFGQLLL